MPPSRRWLLFSQPGHNNPRGRDRDPVFSQVPLDGDRGLAKRLGSYGVTTVIVLTKSGDGGSQSLYFRAINRAARDHPANRDHMKKLPPRFRW
jgi:hypothetical protein